MYSCTFSCRFTSQYAFQLLQHIIHEHFPTVDVFKYCCVEDCQYNSTDSHSVYQHMRDKHWLEYSPEDCDYTVEISCNFCTKYVCEREHTFKKHMDTVHWNLYYRCPFSLCSFKTNLFWELSDHAVESHLEKCIWYFECPECSVGFPEQRPLEQHLFDKHGIESFCRLCRRHYDDLVEHLAADHELTFSISYCSLCNYRYDDDDEEDDLINHLTGTHKLNIPDEWNKIY